MAGFGEASVDFAMANPFKFVFFAFHSAVFYFFVRVSKQAPQKSGVCNGHYND